MNINDVYSLKHIKLEDGNLCFFVSFTDGKGDLIETEISEEIYNHFLSFHREDEAEGRSDRRHLEKSEQAEGIMILPSSQKSSVIKPSQPKMTAVGEPHGGEIPMELLQSRLMYSYIAGYRG